MSPSQKLCLQHNTVRPTHAISSLRSMPVDVTICHLKVALNFTIAGMDLP
jgi:hypothetical protein